MHRTWRAAAVVAFIGVAAALVATVVGVVLADIYRPHAPGVSAAELPSALRRIDQWTEWHRITGTAFGVAAIVALVLVIALVARKGVPGKRTALLIGAATVAALMSVVTVMTRPLVEWDQLALWSDTVGSDIDGYWTAALGHDVRFVLMGNTEVSQGKYGSVLIAHLAAPAVAAAALLLLGTALVRRRTSARTIGGRFSEGVDVGYNADEEDQHLQWWADELLPPSGQPWPGSWPRAQSRGISCSLGPLAKLVKAANF